MAKKFRGWAEESTKKEPLKETVKETKETDIEQERNKHFTKEGYPKEIEIEKEILAEVKEEEEWETVEKKGVKSLTKGRKTKDDEWSKPKTYDTTPSFIGMVTGFIGLGVALTVGYMVLQAISNAVTFSSVNTTSNNTFTSGFTAISSVTPIWLFIALFALPLIGFMMFKPLNR